MNVCTVAAINADMADTAVSACIKEYQIACLQIRLGNLYAVARHRCRRTTQCDAEVFINSVYKAGAIYACVQICAAPYIRCTDELLAVCNYL